MSRDSIFEDPERFVQELVDDPNIVDKQSFNKRLNEVYENNNAIATIKRDQDVVDKLFETKSIQQTVKKNQEFNKIQEDVKESIKIQEKVSQPQFIQVMSMTQKGKKFTYKRGLPKKYSKSEEFGIKRLIKQGLTPKEAFQTYQEKYGNVRTRSSFNSKYYRLK